MKKAKVTVKQVVSGKVEGSGLFLKARIIVDKLIFLSVL